MRINGVEIKGSGSLKPDSFVVASYELTAGFGAEPPHAPFMYLHLQGFWADTQEEDDIALVIDLDGSRQIAAFIVQADLSLQTAQAAVASEEEKPNANGD